MARKTMFFLAVSVFMVTLVGLAGAEAPVMPLSNGASDQYQADPESGLSYSDAWQAREPVETGAVPAQPGSSPDSCCANGGGPTFDQNGFAVPRPGIDDGP